MRDFPLWLYNSADVVLTFVAHKMDKMAPDKRRRKNKTIRKKAQKNGCLSTAFALHSKLHVFPG
jgi:GTP-binding protein EngB required for normal cell division